MSRIILFIIAIALLCASTANAERVFTGTTQSGAYYRIAVPDTWKSGDSLVLFQHGLTFQTSDPTPSLGPIADLQLSEGYAIAASSYSQRAWALFTAPDDNAQLLAVFKQQVGTPGAIIPYGGSLWRSDRAQDGRRSALRSGAGRVCRVSTGGRLARVG